MNSLLKSCLKWLLSKVHFWFLIAQVIVHAGPNLVKTLPLAPAPAKSMKKEYSDLECAVEVVRSVQEAIDHVHQFGSSHTDVIITDNRKKTPNTSEYRHRNLTCLKYLENDQDYCFVHVLLKQPIDGIYFYLVPFFLASY